MIREEAMAAAAASLAALHPHRVVKRGMQDPAVLGDALLRQGVFCLVAGRMKGWPRITGREGQWGTLEFAVVGYVMVDEDPTGTLTERLEQAEALLEDELLQWCGLNKAPPIDAVYPEDCTYSRGLEAPVGWVVMGLEALYV